MVVLAEKKAWSPAKSFYTGSSKTGFVYVLGLMGSRDCVACRKCTAHPERCASTLAPLPSRSLWVLGLDRRRRYHQMRNDDQLTLNASIEWFCESSFAADAVQVESLDFGSFMGDVVPRDGLQRPVRSLVAALCVHVPVVTMTDSRRTSLMCTKQSSKRVLPLQLQLKPLQPRALRDCHT